jgi:NADH-quinone oxidoreductase subunit K
MLCVELMYLGIVSGFIILGVYTNNPEAQIYALIILILAASESAIGLGMLIVLFRYGKNVDFSTYQQLRG